MAKVGIFCIGTKSKANRVKCHPPTTLLSPHHRKLTCKSRYGPSALVTALMSSWKSYSKNVKDIIFPLSQHAHPNWSHQKSHKASKHSHHNNAA
eukprot:746663-Hanusia_phi.AAC.4